MTGHFEARKWQYRQTKEGIVVAFLIHPNDIDAAFAVAPLGTRYMIGFAEIGDDETIVEGPVAQSVERLSCSNAPQEVGGSKPSGSTKNRRSFASLPLSQQAALRCQDTLFVAFLTESYPELPEDFDPVYAVRSICNVGSRREFDGARIYADRWTDLERHFQSWLATNKYAESVR